jgi:adenylate cyclase
MERRLAAILAADVVGYSRLMGEDEAGTLAALKTHRAELIDPKIAQHNGRTVKLMGDGALVEFASVVDAVECAVDIQRNTIARNAGVQEEKRIEFRIGINLGDVIVEGDDLYGDGVNVAARLEGLAEHGGICISGTAYDQLGKKIKVGYEYLGEQWVKNIREPVRAYKVLMEPDAVGKVVGDRRRTRPLSRHARLVGALAALIAIVSVVGWWQFGKPTAHLPVSDKPSIAVLPFDNMGGNPEQEYFADGITEDLITDISKISGLFVIARNSSFAYRNRSVDVREVARELGVRYVLEGSVRRAGDQMRINAQLIDADTGGHLWAERYDGAIADVFALQDKVTRQIVSALAVTLTPEEERGLSQATKVDPAAYDLFLQGQMRFTRYAREPNGEAVGFFERAIALDPAFARAHAGLALTLATAVIWGWTDEPEAASERATKHASAALALDPTIPQIHFASATIHSANRRMGEGVTEMRKAVSLDPNYADGYAAMGHYLCYLGRASEGLQAIQKAVSLNPRHGIIYTWVQGNCRFVLGEDAAAIALLENVLEQNPAHVGARLLLIAIYGQLGRYDDAEWEVAEMLAANPDFSLAAEAKRSRYQRTEDLNRYVEGLRKAGLPE